MSENLGAWLRQQREARGWTKREMARQLIQVGRATGDTSVPGMDSMCHNIHRWERGEGGLTERYKLHYCKAFGIPPDQFGTDPAQPPGRRRRLPPWRSHPVHRRPCHLRRQPPPHLADPRLLVPVAVAYRGIQESDMGDSTVEREVLMAAHDGSDHAEQAEEHGIGEATFEQLRADVVRLSQLTDTGEPFAVFLDMRRVRDRIYRLLNRRLWPREQTDLYFLLGCLNGLMGITANRLGYPDAAEELIRAGWAYATAIDHRPLLGQLRAQLSYIMYWRGRFRESRDLAASGLEYLSEGPAGADLAPEPRPSCGQAGRCGHGPPGGRAMLMTPANATTTMTCWRSAASSPSRWPRTIAWLVARSLTSREAEREAAEELERAISLYDEGPGPRRAALVRRQAAGRH